MLIELLALSVVLEYVDKEKKSTPSWMHMGPAVYDP